MPIDEEQQRPLDRHCPMSLREQQFFATQFALCVALFIVHVALVLYCILFFVYFRHWGNLE